MWTIYWNWKRFWYRKNCREFVLDSLDWDQNAHLDSGCVKFVSNSKKCKIPCSYVGCKTEELWASKCRHCVNSFCLKHRHGQDHDCTALNKNLHERQVKKIEIKEFISSRINLESNSSKKVTTKKSSPHIEMMKLRAKAKVLIQSSK